MADLSFENHLFRIQEIAHSEVSERVDQDMDALENTSQSLREKQEQIYQKRQEFRKNVSFQSTITIATTFFANVLTLLGLASMATPGAPVSLLILATLYQTARQVDSIQKMREHSFAQINAMTGPQKDSDNSGLYQSLDAVAMLALSYYCLPLIAANKSALGKGFAAFSAASSGSKTFMQSDFERKKALLESQSLDLMMQEADREKISQEIEDAIDRQIQLTTEMRKCIELDSQARKEIHQ